MRGAGLLALLLISTLQAQNPYIPKLERNLNENILPFWLRKSIDRTNGGFIISHDDKGVPDPGASKGIVTQARQVWLFSRAAREGYQPKETLAAATHGFTFLRDRMWDKKYGGFYWEVDASGTKQLKPKKHLYGESFGLFALSEYYLTTKDKTALVLANQLFRLFETKAHDKEYGGYRESFKEDWTADQSAEPNYMNVPVQLKLMNTHLHLLEALTSYYRASKSPAAKERLIELINIQSNAVVRKDLAACTDKYEADWTPKLDGPYATVSYGHDLENVWLLIDACKAIGTSPYPLLDLSKSLWSYSLKYGYDEQNGGFFNSGAFNKPAESREKVWWVQSEATVSALHMYKLTNDKKYLDVFAKTYDFIEAYQIDRQVGEWHETVTPDGQSHGAKASIWKAGYHNGRAMMESLLLLRSLDP